MPILSVFGATEPLVTTESLLNMQANEMAIWSAMAGVLLTLAVVATMDVASRPTLASARLWVSLWLTGWICVLMTGLPEALWPSWRSIHWLPMKATLGPLCGVLAMTYLGHWSGLSREDRLVNWMMGPGAFVLLAGTFVLLGLVFFGASSGEVLPLTGALNSLAVVMGVVIAVRSVTLGDELARWMVLACLCLAQMTAGLYGKGLGMDMGNLYWGLTAAATVGYFITVAVLVRLRSRQFRRLRRQIEGRSPVLDSAGLPRGAQVIARVEEALWRSARMDRPCLVAAVSLSNLYACGDHPDAESEILVTLAARIRQVVGFRNVVGLYHQRCFVLAVSAVQDPQRAELVVSRLLRELRMSVHLGPDPKSLPFQPEVAIGVVRVAAHTGDDMAIPITNLAEQLALQAQGDPQRLQQRTWVARPPTPMVVAPSLADTQPATI
jgi:GGDEF domain-containing protein